MFSRRPSVRSRFLPNERLGLPGSYRAPDSGVRRPLRLLLLLSALAGVGSFSIPAYADDAQQTALARTLAKEGFEAFQEGNFPKALDLFTRAENIHHATTHLLYMARCEKELGRPVEAFEMYNRVLREDLDPKAPDAFAKAQISAREEIEHVEALIGYVTIEVSGPGAEEAELLVDDVALPAGLLGVKTPVNPGRRTFAARSGDAKSEPLILEIESGVPQTVELTLVPGTGGSEAPAGSHEAVVQDGSSPSKVPAYVLLGVGGVGVALGTVFLVQHFSKKGKAANSFDSFNCEVACTSAEKDEIDDYDQDAATAGTVSVIAYGVGAAGLAAGVTLLLLSPKQTQESAGKSPPKASIHPYAGWAQVGVYGSF